MTKVTRSKDCGNSPKNGMVEDIAIGLETGDTGLLATLLDDGASWNCSDNSDTCAEDILASLGKLSDPKALTIDHVMSHGKVGAVNGHTTHGNNIQRFCHVIEFTNTKCNRVTRIESY